MIHDYCEKCIGVNDESEANNAGKITISVSILAASHTPYNNDSFNGKFRIFFDSTLRTI